MNDKHGAKYAFYYLLSLVSLVFVGISVGMIAFGIIDKTIFDPLSYNSYTSSNDSGLKFAISALFIAAPAYYLSLSLIRKGLKGGELAKDSAIRRWLTYFIILVSSLIILGVFVGVINNFLSGELSTRFILKAAAMLVISGLAFSYYFYDVKHADRPANDRAGRIFFFASLFFVAAAFVSAWFFVESPKEARMRRLDQIVVNHISSLESMVNTFYSQKDRLPESINEVKDNSGYIDPLSFVDPESGAPIEYKKLGDKEFEFCADFRLASEPGAENGAGAGTSYPVQSGISHKAGRDCLKGNLWATIKAEEAEKGI